jgi:dTDP-4-amino-4,6-dideoxygalactose transaminase
VIPFHDLQPIRRALAEPVDAAVRRALGSGWYILGPEVEAFENAFATYHGGGSAVGVANGTDAIELALRAAGIGLGDEVITVAHTAVATVCAVERAGARPVLVDIDPLTYTMDPAAARAAITPRTRALLPVHLYGHPAAMGPLTELADRHGLLLVEDCAQAHGARSQGRLVGTFGQLAAFSFYPTKVLGAYGDGGAVLTSDPALAARLRRLRTYGQTDRYHHAERGINSRLDEVQAAILGVKLAHLDAQIAERRRLADGYRLHLTGVDHPVEADGVEHVYHLYVVRSPRRDDLRARLRERGMETQIHYPLPVHLQPAYADLGYPPGSLPATERACATIVSLPMYSGLDAAAIARVGREMVPFLGMVA